MGKLKGAGLIIGQGNEWNWGSCSCELGNTQRINRIFRKNKIKKQLGYILLGVM